MENLAKSLQNTIEYLNNRVSELELLCAEVELERSCSYNDLDMELIFDTEFIDFKKVKVKLEVNSEVKTEFNHTQGLWSLIECEQFIAAIQTYGRDMK